MKFNANIQLNTAGEIVFANVERGAALPAVSGVVNGTMFFNTTDDQLYGLHNGVWTIIGSGDIINTMNELSDVTLTSPSTNQVLIYDSSSPATFSNKTIQYKYSYTSTGTTTHVINHNLNQLQVLVQVYDTSSNPDRVVIPDEVQVNSANQCTVVLNEDIFVDIIITAVGTIA